MPKRNKGRLFVGTIFLAFVSVVGYFCWTTFVQYRAWGIIHGRIITVSAPWNGIVINWQVKDGELVQQGQPLAEISNLAMRHDLESLIDRLKLTQAKLEAETSKLKFEKQNLETTTQQALADYLQLSGELQAQEAKLTDLDRQLTRARKLIKSKNLSQQKYDELYYEFIGQQRRIAKTRDAVEVLRERTRLAKRDQGYDWQQQIQPLLAEIKTTESEIKRIQEKIQLGRLVAPVSGRITRRLVLTGESVDLNEHVVEILEDNSTEAILFVPQKMGDQFAVGDIVELELEPYSENLQGEITRLGDQFLPPPNQIKRFYASEEVLLPVHLRPLPEYEQFMSFRINGTIKLPIKWDQGVASLVETLKGQFESLISANTESGGDDALERPVTPTLEPTEKSSVIPVSAAGQD